MKHNKTVTVYGAVVVTGGEEALAGLKERLTPDFRCNHYRANALLVEDVVDHELPALRKQVREAGADVEKLAGSRQLRIAADEENRQRKVPNLNLIAGGWYKTKKDAPFPLIHVISIRNEQAADGEVLWLFDVDFVDAGALPMQATVDADRLKRMDPKPASLDDFEKLDIIPPAGFEAAPHTIPEDGGGQDKKAGVADFTHAQIAATKLTKTSPSYVEAKVVRAPAGGFMVEAQVFGRPTELPETVNEVPIEYLF